MFKKLKFSFFLFGAYPLFKFLNTSQQGFRNYFINQNLNLSETYSHKEKDNYAFVTGCTSGLGKEFAFQLAQKGYNLLLVSKDQEKLKKLKQELFINHPTIQVQTIQFDFSTIDLNNYDELFNQLDNYSVSILVNNVASINKPEFFQNKNIKDIDRLNIENTLPATLLTNYFVKKFYNQYEDSKKKSGIINIGSSINENAIYPLQSDYVATKNYINHLTRCFELEVDRNKIDTLLVTPTNINTNIGERLNQQQQEGKKQKYWNDVFNVQKYAFYLQEEKSQVVKNALNNLGNTNWIYGSYKLGILQTLVNIGEKVKQTQLFWQHQYEGLANQQYVHHQEVQSPQQQLQSQAFQQLQNLEQRVNQYDNQERQSQEQEDTVKEQEQTENLQTIAVETEKLSEIIEQSSEQTQNNQDSSNQEQ